MSARLESNGTWTAQVWYRDYHGDQRHKTKRGFASEDEALAWEEDFVDQASETVNSTFEDFYEVYAEDMKPRLREHTWNTKQYINHQEQDSSLLREDARRRDRAH